MIWLLVVEEEIFIHTRSLSPSYSHNLPTCPNINKTSSGILKYKHGTPLASKYQAPYMYLNTQVHRKNSEYYAFFGLR